MSRPPSERVLSIRRRDRNPFSDLSASRLSYRTQIAGESRENGPVSLVHSTTHADVRVVSLRKRACNSNIRVRVYSESDMRTYNIAVLFFDTCFHKNY